MDNVKKYKEEKCYNANYFEHIQEKVIEGAFIVQNQQIKYCNGIGAEIIGYKNKNDLINVNIFEIISAKYRIIAETYYNRTIEDKDNTFEFTLQMLCLDGNSIKVKVKTFHFARFDELAVLWLFEKIFEPTIAKEIRKIEKKYKLLLEIPVEAVGFVVDNVVVDANMSFVRLFGCSTIEEIINKSIYNFVVETDHKIVNHYIDRNINKKSSTELFEIRAKKMDGFIFPVEMRVTSISEANMPNLMITFRDISAISETLRECKMLAGFLNNVNDNAFGVNRNNNIIYANKSAYKTFGYAPGELINVQIYDLVSFSDRYKIENAIKSLKTTLKIGETKTIEVICNKKDNSCFNVDMTITYLEDKERNIEYFLVTSKDITDMFCENLIKQSPIAMQVFQLDGTTVRVNDAYENLWDIKKEEVVWKYNCFKDKGILKTDLLLSLKKAFDGEIVNLPEVEYFPSFNGSSDKKTLVSIKLYPLTDKSGELLNVVMLFEDITDKKDVELEREKSITVLEQKNKEMESFIYSASHDLRSPLMNVQGMVSILVESIENSDNTLTYKLLSRITSAIQGLDLLLTDMLELSKVGKVIDKFSKINFKSIVDESIFQLMTLIRQRNIRLEVVEPFPTVFVDKTRILQVLVNLISNSIKYSDNTSDPVIRIGWEKSNGKVIFYVKDNGMGIAKSEQKKIFNLFYKINSRSNGTGVGLAIVKKIIEVHNGKIWVKSCQGESEGTTFFFTLGQ